MSPQPASLDREILLAFWKIHILHHAAERSVYGQWIAQELREHGYEISPGTLYPLLDRMERSGWLTSRQSVAGNPRSRRDYRLTPAGRRILERLRAQVSELYREVARPSRGRKRR
jgi:DNA-binding PadR family transcriptional regulator